MTEKEINIKTAVNFLSALYGNERSWDVNALATIHSAEADGNVGVICDALKGVSEFCESLITKIKEQ